MKQIAVAFTIALLLVGLALPVVVTQVDAASGIPTFSVVSVAPGEKVTIQTDNFPANKTFLVLIGEYGTLGKGGTPITTIESGKGGAFQATFTLPEALKKNEKLAIRLESSTGGYYAYNWFDNVTITSSSSTSAPSASAPSTSNPAPKGYTGIPTFSISSVDAGKKVSITTNNFPAGYDFKVLINKFGTLGIGGTQVATTSSGNGGSFNASYELPAALKDECRLAIRLESTKGGFYAFNWFDNPVSGCKNTTPAPTYNPSVTFTSVEVGVKVTLKASGFPAETEVKVLMGKFGTMGVGGTQVASVKTDKNGVLAATYDIPSALKEECQVVVRIESTSGGYVTYNWFNNFASGSTKCTTKPGYYPSDTGENRGLPYMTITAVDKGKSVTFTAYNLPANADFKVLLGKFGTMGVGGTEVSTFSSGKGGSVSITVNIPASFKDTTPIAIRIESTKGGYYAYNWFNNK
ncbi:MAG TPA: hypothetical protein PKW33_08160 [Anaerolineaceae bacterium]|nr:hypothetical protein [Anaerolineaceae bacterium]HPN51546.1 hypothetical protein [Anaerolineaceae bacterium]